MNSIFTQNNNNIDTAVLSGIRASPQKDLTSDGTSVFAMGRQDFMRSYNSGCTIPQNVQKKWIGGNRDCSQIVDKRRMNAIGNSLNPSGGNVSNMCKANANVIREAKQRVRSGGCVAPAKKIHKYKDQPVFY
jgi:hypothetical protein